MLRRQGWRNRRRQWKICGFLIADVFQLSIAHSLPSSYYHRTHSSRRRWPFSTSRQFSPLFTRSCTTKYSLVDNPFSKNAALCVETAWIALPERKHVYVVPLVELSAISRRVSTAEDKNNACNLGRCETVWPLSTTVPANPPLSFCPLKTLALPKISRRDEIEGRGPRFDAEGTCNFTIMANLLTLEERDSKLSRRSLDNYVKRV